MEEFDNLVQTRRSPSVLAMKLRTVPIHNKTRYSANRVYISCDALYQRMEYDMSVFLILVVDLRHCLRHEDQRSYYRNFHQYWDDRN